MAKIPIHICIVILLCGPVNTIFGFVFQEDSLKMLLRSANNDTAKINILHQLAEDNLYADPILALEYCNAIYQLSDELKFQEEMIDALTLKARIYAVMGKSDSAVMAGNAAIHLSDSIANPGKMANSSFQLAIILFNVQGAKPANRMFQKSYEAYKMLSDSSGMANTLNAIGITYFNLAKYDSAIFSLLEAVRIAEINNAQHIVAKAYANLGMVYQELEEYSNAKKYLTRSISYNRETGNLINEGKSLHNLGNVYISEGKLDSAWYTYNKELELNLSENYLEGIANAYTGLGDVWDRKSNDDKALEYFSKALIYYDSINHLEGILISYKNLGMIEWHRGNFQQAMIVYDSSLAYAKKQGLPKRMVEIYRNICNNYVEMGDYRNAYKNHVKLTELVDSILSIEKHKIIVDLELQYEMEKNRAENLMLISQNLEKDLTVERRTRQRNTYLFTGAGLILIFIFFFIYYSQRTRKNRIIAEQKINQLEEEKKLLAARSIVEGQEEERKRIAKELHDGLGVLLSSAKMHFTTIRDKSTENKGLMDKAAKLLEQATGDVRRISHNMMPGLLTKFGLYEALEDLLDQLNDMKDIKAGIEIEGEKLRLPENTEIMLYRIIQEMVNNTLKHAEANTIGLFIQVEPKQIKFRYWDNGKGFDANEKKESKSIGLTSIHSRVKFLGGNLMLNTAPNKGVEYKFVVPLS